ncbi:MAG: type VI secretion system tip protein TssI/VgrG [Polyangiaceae bacterium]
MHSLHVDGLEPSLRVVRFSGHESISQGFQLGITVSCDHLDLHPGSVVGRAATLTIDAGQGPRAVHGIVSRFAHVDPWRNGAEYHLTLVPAMARLRLRTDSRIYQGLSVPEIIADVLRRAGFRQVSRRERGLSRALDRAETGDFDMVLGASHAPRESCVQYRETDWDFVHRLLEEEGILSFFEHDDSAHRLVISDSPTVHEPISGADTLPFRPQSGMSAAEEHVARFHFAEESRPDRVAVSDYQFERPLLRLDASAEAGAFGTGTVAATATAGGGNAFEVYEHPGHHDHPEAGMRTARMRIEEIQATRWVSQGESSSSRLVPGRTFVLTDHPSSEMNRRYLITRVEHRGAEPANSGGAEERYVCRFEAIPADVAFRPPRRTPRPVIPGIQTAIVVGPPGEEIHTDRHGRVKVRFHWDRTGYTDDRCSAWIRVAQASAGAAFGSVFLPRVGHEVVVDFIEGDPDRPLITGSVYHGANVPPLALPAEKTKSTVKTSSTPGGGGSNELRFEDQKGAEEVYLHAQKDLSIQVENDKSLLVGANETSTVSGNRTVQVNAFDTETVLLAQTVTVGGALTQTVGAIMTTAVVGAKFEMVGMNSSEKVVLNKSVKAGIDHKVTAGKNASTKAVRNVSVHAGRHVTTSSGLDTTITSGRRLTAMAASSVDVTAGEGMSVVVTGDHKEDATKTRTIVAGEEMAITCGDSRITMKKDGTILIEGKDITVVSKKDPVQIRSEGPVNVVAKGKVQITGKSVDLN